MDLLSQYKQDSPRMVQEIPVLRNRAEYGYWIRLMINVSGGRIGDEKQATYILFGCATVMIVIAAVVTFLTFRVPQSAVPHGSVAGPGDPAFHSQR